MSCETCTPKSTLGQIIEGWGNYIFPDKEVENKAKVRALVCATCSYNKSGFCVNCDGIPCPIATKTRSMSTNCYKWDKHKAN